MLRLLPTDRRGRMLKKYVPRMDGQGGDARRISRGRANPDLHTEAGRVGGARRWWSHLLPLRLVSNSLSVSALSQRPV